MSKRTFVFAAAMPPRAEAAFPTGRWLRAIADAGYTHLCLQNDPFFHPEMDLRDMGENSFRLLDVYDLTAGPRHRAYLEWLRCVNDRAVAFGLRLALQLWEPRLSRLARQALPPEWKGPAMAGGWVEPLCVGHPRAREWLLDGFRTIFAHAPALDSLILGINDNAARLCDASCSRCGGIPETRRLADLYCDIEQACQAVNPEMRVVAYDWFWDEATYEALLPRLSTRSFVLTRLERGALHTPDPEHPEMSGEVCDQCLGCNQTGTDFAKAKAAARRYGHELLVMPTLSGMFEGLLLPYVPAAGQVARKFDTMRRHRVRGWADFDCGGIHEGLMLDLVAVVQHHPDWTVDQWLDLLARQRYGESAHAVGGQAWDHFDEAVTPLPVALKGFGPDGLRQGPITWLLCLMPWHPFLPKRLKAIQQGAVVSQCEPLRYIEPQFIPMYRPGILKAIRAGLAGLAALQRALAQADDDHRQAVAHDAALGELAVLSWQSAANFLAWGAAQLAMDAPPLTETLTNEIAVTRRYRELARRWELGVSNATHAIERMVARTAPQVVGDHANLMVEGYARWVDPQPCPEQIGDLFAWKIAHLNMQLARACSDRSAPNRKTPARA